MKRYDDWYLDGRVCRREEEIRREFYESNCEESKEDIEELKSPHKD